MQAARIIKRQLERLGNRLCLTDGGWTSVPFYAYVYPLWRKKTAAFEPAFTQLGTDSKLYYLYIGPHDHDITALSNAAEVQYQNRRFVFLRRDAVRVGDAIVYYTGILKRLEEESYDEYSDMA